MASHGPRLTTWWFFKNNLMVKLCYNKTMEFCNVRWFGFSVILSCFKNYISVMRHLVCEVQLLYLLVSIFANSWVLFWCHESFSFTKAVWPPDWPLATIVTLWMGSASSVKYATVEKNSNMKVSRFESRKSKTFGRLKFSHHEQKPKVLMLKTF